MIIYQEEIKSILQHREPFLFLDSCNILEIGKVGTGIKELETEEGVTFAQLTELLKPLILSEKGVKVIVKPKIVVEINYEEIQKSPTYNSGYALRFPRMIQIRQDKPINESSGLNLVEQLYAGQM